MSPAPPPPAGRKKGRKPGQTGKELLDLVRSKKRVSIPDASRELHLTGESIRYAAKPLLKDGTITSYKRGNKIYFEITRQKVSLAIKPASSGKGSRLQWGDINFLQALERGAHSVPEVSRKAGMNLHQTSDALTSLIKKRLVRQEIKDGQLVLEIQRPALEGYPEYKKEIHLLKLAMQRKREEAERALRAKEQREREEAERARQRELKEAERVLRARKRRERAEAKRTKEQREREEAQRAKEALASGKMSKQEHIEYELKRVTAYLNAKKPGVADHRAIWEGMVIGAMLELVDHGILPSVPKTRKKLVRRMRTSPRTKEIAITMDEIMADFKFTLSLKERKKLQYPEFVEEG